MSTGFELRGFRPEDLPAVETISREIYGEQHESADEWRFAQHDYHNLHPHRRRYVAVDGGTGQVCGYGCLTVEPWMIQVKRRWLQVMVHPERQRQGMGNALFTCLMDDMAEMGVASVEARVAENRGEGFAFLRKRGFVEQVRVWTLLLTLSEADPAASQSVFARLEARGITIATLVEERMNTPDCYRKIHQLWNVIAADQPMYDPATEPPFEPFVQWLERPGGLPGACFIAKDGNEYVGMSMLVPRAAKPGWLTQNITGARREYRRLGVATALKVRTIEFARRHGYAGIVTKNDSNNAAMLALNEKLGFRRQVGWVTLEKPLVP